MPDLVGYISNNINLEGTIQSRGPAGKDGTDGVNGADGVGVPSGGTTGQVLAKKSNTDYDTEWVDEGATNSVITVIKSILQKAVFTEDVSSLFSQLDSLINGGSESNITQNGTVLTIISGVTVSQSGTVLTLS